MDCWTERRKLAERRWRSCLLASTLVLIANEGEDVEMLARFRAAVKLPVLESRDCAASVHQP